MPYYPRQRSSLHNLSANDQIIEEGEGRESSDDEAMNIRTPTRLGEKKHKNKFGSAEHGLTDTAVKTNLASANQRINAMKPPP